ncbi:RNase adapter RapZ [Thermodesulfatator atlanticus]|uniref:RNase adapter RapZ n=1 Tax=Thermodesulfatator atlanticus TaxID=501497 RepID=UPI0003B4BA6B|nr:RNase adapter RapZ [Thermodesulfatator atlanticus]
MTTDTKKNIQTVIITGLSGSGKSTVLRAFEDLGFFGVDNLPVELLPAFLDIKSKQLTDKNSLRLALVMDVREESFVKSCKDIFDQVKKEGYHLEIVFLEASDEVLIARFSQTRRPHPLAPRSPLAEALKLERALLADVKEIADVVIDTSKFNVHQLRREIKERFGPRKDLTSLLVHLMSFGFKYGVPPEAHILFDVRFLANPYFDPALKPLSGLDEKIRKYVLGVPETTQFLALSEQYLRFLLPQYEKEGKTYLVVGIGCTGGRHRSVVIAQEIGAMIKEWGWDTIITHRDIDKEAAK